MEPDPQPVEKPTHDPAETYENGWPRGSLRVQRPWAGEQGGGSGG